MSNHTFERAHFEALGSMPCATYATYIRFVDGDGLVIMDNMTNVLREDNSRDRSDKTDILPVMRLRRNSEMDPRYEAKRSSPGIYVRARSKHTA
eukprot:6492640-Amphidinium_carterae.2